MAQHDTQLDRLFTALGDPTRRAILARLARGPASVSELASAHAMALPSFLKHLGRLQDAGLITSEKAGRVRHCALAPDALTPARAWLDEQRALWETRLDQFDAYVAQLMTGETHGARPEDRPET